MQKNTRFKCMLVITELVNIAVNYFDAKKSARCSLVFVLPEIIVSGTQRKCTLPRFFIVNKIALHTHGLVNI